MDTTNLQVNMDWQHLIMNGENLAEYADLLASEHKLGHQHGNDGWGTFDDDNVVGTNFMQTLELAQTLQDTGYGEDGEIIGFDLYPYTEDQVAAVGRAILQWEFVWDLARKIDRANSARPRPRRRPGRPEGPYAALGMDDGYGRRSPAAAKARQQKSREAFSSASTWDRRREGSPWTSRENSRRSLLEHTRSPQPTRAGPSKTQTTGGKGAKEVVRTSSQRQENRWLASGSPGQMHGSVFLDSSDEV